MLLTRGGKYVISNREMKVHFSSTACTYTRIGGNKNIRMWGEQLILWENDRNRVTYAKAVLYDNFTTKVGRGGDILGYCGCEKGWCWDAMLSW